MRELSFRGKPESENFCLVEDENLSILVLWKKRIREFSFCGKRESPFFFFFIREFPLCGKPEWENFFFIRESSFCGKRELESRFVENQNRRIFFFLSDNSRFVETENSRFVENGNWRILVLWKTRIGEFSFFGKSESENSRFVENETPRILVLWKTRMPKFCEKRQFLFCGK